MIPRALFLTEKTPQPGAGGAMAYAFDFVQTLREFFDIDCLALGEERFLREGRVLASSNGVFAFAHPRFFRRGAFLYSPKNWIRQKTRSRFYDCQLPDTSISASHALDHRFAEALSRRTRYDLVVANYFWKAELLRHFPDARKAILAHDVFHHHVNASKVERWADRQPITAAREAKELSQADLVVAISDRDARVFSEIGVSAEIVAAPMSARLKPKPKDPALAQRMLFIGSPYLPNVEGILWFVEQVWPLIRRQAPAAQLDVVGDVCLSVPQIQSSGVNLRGRVADLGEIYRTADVVVVPILRGTGMKIKLVEAIDHETPFVSTVAGALGMERLLSPDDAVVTDDPETFATAALQPMTSREERDRSIARIRDLKRRHFAPEAAHHGLRIALQRSIDRRPKHR